MSKIACFILLLVPHIISAQTNCSVYKDAAHKNACELYNEAIQQSQGSRSSQLIFLRSVQACPSFAPSLNEMSVPYLKRGDFYTWKRLIDRAVKADPQYLATRGWCLFKFLRDYKNAYADLKKIYDRNSGIPGYSGDGDYDLRIVMALALRELGDKSGAMKYFDESITASEKNGVVGLFDYLHRGVTKYKRKHYQAALFDLLSETKKYEKLADTYYYIGITYFKLRNFSEARKNLLKAKKLFLHTGYHRNDPYCEALDQVYLSDIVAALKKTRN